MDNSRTLSVQLKYILDAKALESVKSGNSTISSELKKIEQNATSSMAVLEKLSNISKDMQMVGKRMFVGGVGILGAMFLEAKRYIDSAKESNDITRRWSASMQKLETSHNRISKVVAQEMLPIIEKAVTYLDKFATFIEQNPGVVKAAVNIGTALVVMGAITVALGKVLDIVTRIAGLVNLAKGYFAKTLATEVATTAGGGAAISTTSAGTIIGSALVYAIALYVGAKAGEFIGNKLGKAVYGEDYKEQDLSDAGKTAFRILKLSASGFTAVAEELGIVAEGSTLKVLRWGETVGDASDEAAKGAAGITAFERSIVDAYVAMKEREVSINQQYNEQVLSVNEQYHRSVLQAEQNHAKAIEQIASSSSAAISNIVASFQSDMAQMEADYISERADIISSGQEQIEQIQRDSQERLREMAIDHEKRVRQLTLSRDALGLAQENADYKEAVNEEKRRARAEIQRAKQETQNQLSELDRRYAEEKAQREQAYKDQLAAQSAQDSAAREQADAAYKAELEQLQNAKETELAELSKNHQKELAANRRAFYQQIRDLNNALADERGLRNEYYSLMLEDARAFMEQYRSEMEAEGSSAPSYDDGGYLYPGLFRVGQGQREFVMNSRTTRSAETLLGRKLNQQNVLGLASAGTNITIQVGNGMTLMEAKKVLVANRRELFSELETTFGSM